VGEQLWGLLGFVTFVFGCILVVVVESDVSQIAGGWDCVQLAQ
jgi:hypothetical protein